MRAADRDGIEGVQVKGGMHRRGATGGYDVQALVVLRDRRQRLRVPAYASTCVHMRARWMLAGGAWRSRRVVDGAYHQPRPPVYPVMRE